MLRRIGGKPENADKKCGDGNTNNHTHTHRSSSDYVVADTTMSIGRRATHSTRGSANTRIFQQRIRFCVWQKRVITKVFAAQFCVRHSQMRIALFAVFLALLLCHCAAARFFFPLVYVQLNFLSLPRTTLSLHPLALVLHLVLLFRITTRLVPLYLAKFNLLGMPHLQIIVICLRSFLSFFGGGRDTNVPFMLSNG